MNTIKHEPHANRELFSCIGRARVDDFTAARLCGRRTTAMIQLGNMLCGGVLCERIVLACVSVWSR